MVKKLLCLLLVLIVAVITWYCSKCTFEKRINLVLERLDSIETVIGDMQKVDTLILDISEYNAKGIEVLNENHEIISSRIVKAERQVNRINSDLDAVD